MNNFYSDEKSENDYKHTFQCEPVKLKVNRLDVLNVKHTNGEMLFEVVSTLNRVTKKIEKAVRIQ